MDPVNLKTEQESPIPEQLLRGKETGPSHEVLASKHKETTLEKSGGPEESLKQTKAIPTPSLETVTKRVPASATVAPPKDRLEREIESVLEEDLADMYKSLPAEKQKEFREEGEKTAAAIRVLAIHAKKHASKILHLIKRWLRLIPGVNRFFLEQEAKIKTDKIVLVAEEEDRRKEQQIT